MKLDFECEAVSYYKLYYMTPGNFTPHFSQHDVLCKTVSHFFAQLEKYGLKVYTPYRPRLIDWNA